MTTATVQEQKKPPSSAPSPPTSPAKAPEVTNFQLLRRALIYLVPVRRLALAIGGLIVLAMFLEIAAVYTNRLIINRVQDELQAKTLVAAESFWESFWERFTHEPMRGTVLMIGLLGLLVLAGAITRFIREYTQTKLTMDMVFHMRSAVYDRLQRVGFAFHDEHSSGALINRALSDLQNVRAFLNNSLIMIIEIVVFVLGYNLLILRINPWAALVALVPIPFWILYIRKFAKGMQPVLGTQMKSADDLTTVLTENIAGVHVVKAFATETTEVKKYNTSADTYFANIIRTVNLWRNFTPVVRGIASASHLSLFAMGAMLIVKGYCKVGDLLAFGTAMGSILGRLQQINTISDQYQRAVVSARRFYEILDAPSTVPELPAAPCLPQGSGAVEFHFVTFGYAAEKPVVKDIAFDVAGGSVVALVGPTGAGKSTLVQLLARFYDPQGGAIYIDGVDIRKVSLASLRESIGFVFQETFLFSDTVANNIRYGHPEATQGDIEAAARIAQAHEFILELPKGYDTMLGERGATLSGGQRQRLAIARAIVSNPRILVLDDALAAVDPETEHLISRALELVMVDRTVFIIAHRLSTVKASDLVIVLENGRITQAGTHKELLREQGHYRHIAEVQLAYQEKEIIAAANKTADIAAVGAHGQGGGR